ncbi:hypothetical protein [Antarcticirhabdus aurantiaca]|uniref:Uncharacterized protein n=1 Tax=Antarcticirhabdus aurantiaca TaxID=2606717 RepID=A0ACD4NQY5_9HYPH|nr:hypothetical protein [Antarcticirhabdus aurantiaca]WAJ29158.1 hypothetical protein OXU80_02630 [Jeongeuplla avenae]
MLQDRKNPFYRPLWVRLLILAVCAGWSAFEWWNGEPTWMMIALAITAYAVYSFFIAFDPDDRSAGSEK